MYQYSVELYGIPCHGSRQKSAEFRYFWCTEIPYIFDFKGTHKMLMGSSGGSWGAMVAHGEQWWLMRSSGGLGDQWWVTEEQLWLMRSSGGSLGSSGGS
jgi:hypothetical protein